MAASYPNAIKNFLVLEDGVDKVIAAHPNDRAAEITAIETEIGTNPKGTKADLKTRLAVFLNDDGTPKLLGAWESKSNNTSYLAATDGLVTAYSPGEIASKDIQGYTDAANPPTQVKQRSYTNDLVNVTIINITFLVRKGDYWKVTGANMVNWIPLGS